MSASQANPPSASIGKSRAFRTPAITLVAGASLIALAAGGAWAADLQVKAAPGAPYYVPQVPLYSWSGFYIGGNIGGGWSRDQTDVLPGPDAATFVHLLPQTLSTNSSGVVGGGQIGYNWQAGPWVWGIEADIQGADIRGTVVESPIIPFIGAPIAGSALSIQTKLDWFGTVRGRFGTTFIDPRFLLYVTGGLAFGNVDDTANAAFPTVQYPAALNTTRTGWSAGVGGEWAFAQHWTAKVEWLRVDLGSASVTGFPIPPNPPFTVTYNFKTVDDIVRFGINYKFW
jgi:outer membrane immunogenic protein